MRVAILNTKETLRARYLLESFAEGVRTHGDEPFWVEKQAGCVALLQQADVGVQVCFPNVVKSANAISNFRVVVNDQLFAQGKRVLTIDTGFVKNQSDYELQAGSPQHRHEVLFDIGKKETYEKVLLDIHYEVGFDGLKRNADYCNKRMPGDRWARLGKSIKPWRQDGRHILLVGQTLHGLSSQHVDIFDWYARTLTVIRKHTDRPVVFRHHPRITKIRHEGNRVDKDRRAIIAKLKSPKHFSWSTGWFVEDDLQDAWAAVVFTSNAAVTAALEGIPVFVGDPACMAWPVGNYDLRRIESPKLPERKQWAHDLAYAQWSVAEFKSGECWAHLRAHAQASPSRHWRARTRS